MNLSVEFFVLTDNGSLPRETPYWLEDADINATIVEKIHSNERYLKIMRNFTLNGSTTVDDNEDSL